MLPSNHNSQDRAYWYLKDRIINLELRPGERLKTVAIAKALDISRTPVREALGRLEQEGLVTRDSGWGYVVKGLSLKEARDIYKVREALEVEAAREAIGNLNDKALDQLAQLLRKAEKHWESGKVKEFRKCTRQFHLSIAHASNNDALKNLIAVIDDRVRLLGAILFDHHLDRGKESLAQNRAILQALKSKDVLAAEQAVRVHVSHARECMMKYLTHGSSSVQLLYDNQQYTKNKISLKRSVRVMA